MSLPTTIDVTRNPIDSEPTLHVMNGTGMYIQIPVTRAEFWRLVERFGAMFPQTVGHLDLGLAPIPIDTGSIVTVADDVWNPTVAEIRETP